MEFAQMASLRAPSPTPPARSATHSDCAMIASLQGISLHRGSVLVQARPSWAEWAGIPKRRRSALNKAEPAFPLPPQHLDHTTRGIKLAACALGGGADAAARRRLGAAGDADGHGLGYRVRASNGATAALPVLKLQS